MTTAATERVAPLTTLARLVLDNGDHDTALNLLDQATATIEMLVRADVEDRPELRRELLLALCNRAEVAMLAKRFDEAEAGLQRALGLLEQLPDADSAIRVGRYVQLASLYRQTERWQSAIRLQRRAADLVREGSDWRVGASAADHLAVLLAELANLYRLAGDHDAAETAERQSLEVLLGVPPVPGGEHDRRERLATAVSRIADIANERGEDARAARLWLASNQIRESPNADSLAWAAMTEGPLSRYPTLQVPSHLHRVDLAPLLGLERLDDWTPDEFWAPRPKEQQLRVPIGLGVGGETIVLDLKESALGGDGPHGLLVGATGSGKSELLRTLVLGLALTHSPEQLNFMLVDFKGGATFAGFDALPHMSALITNLQDEQVLVDRTNDALHGELMRRQEALREAGNFASVKDYERARAQGAAFEPMPSLLVLVDEFSELLAAKPSFVELFVMIGRIGRSLGVHLLLASQRIEEGKLRGLDTHLSYRLSLRTFSALESRAVLGDERANTLPSLPGAGYLKTWTTHTDPVAFQSAYVSGPEEGSDERDPAYRTAVDRIVEAQASPARQLWLPPLDVSPTLGELLVDREGAPTLAAPVGVIDRPFDQRRDLHWIELASSHFVVVGRPQSGKSTVLRTLVAGIALTHAPEDVQFYCLDFGGGTLSGVADLPHVGSVAGPFEPERLRRTVAEITRLLAAREQMFIEHRIDSMALYRRMLAAGTAPRDGYGDVVLLVDGWGLLCHEYEALETAIMQILTRGLGFGVHVVLSVQRWMDLRPEVRDLVSGRLELRLGDPGESEVDRRLAADVPRGRPGRGLSPQKLHFLAALPRIDGSAGNDDLASGISDLVRRVGAAWSGQAAPPVRLLPRQLAYEQLPPPPADRAALPIGVDEDELAPVFLDFDAEAHFLVLGDDNAGKSTVLRTIACGITARWSPDQSKIITFDYRRGLLGAVTTSHQIGYVMNSVTASQVVADIIVALRERLADMRVHPAARIAPRWTGPRLFVLVDDYDLVASSQADPLLPLLEFLPLAGDIGVHLIVSHAAGGAEQGMQEQVMRGLRDMGTPVLLLSGGRDEGTAHGSVRTGPLPPGRGWLIRRRTKAVLVQTSFCPPATPS